MRPRLDLVLQQRAVISPGGLWSRGFPLAGDKMQPARQRRVPLPTYPFQRKRFAPSALGPAASPVLRKPAPSVRGLSPRQPGPEDANHDGALPHRTVAVNRRIQVK